MLTTLHLAVIAATLRGVETDGQRTALLWGECLLRASRPSFKRVEGCIEALKREFDLTV